MQRRNVLAAIALGAIALFAAQTSAQNLLANPGFEDPITYDGPPFVGFWEGFSGAPTATAANSTASPRSGTMNLDLTIQNTDTTFTGVFQDVPNLVPGAPVTFSGWHRTPSNPLDVGIEFRIEWRSSVTNTEISRTPNQTTAPGSTYSQFNLDSTVPVGADLARVVYAIQTFGAEPTNNGTVFIDDTSFIVVPEPASLSLLGLAGLVAIRRRR